MKNGLIEENGKLVYYENDEKKHAGVINIDGNIYYINSHGYAVRGTHVVHKEMTNGLLEHGTYTFGEDGRLIEGSYLAPIKEKSSKKKKKKKRSKKQKEDLKLLMKILAAALAGAILLGVGWVVKQYRSGESSVVTEESEKEEKILLPDLGGKEILLCTEGAKLVFDGEDTVAHAVAAGGAYVPFEYEYDIGEKSGIFVLSENSDLSDAKQYVIGGGSDSLVIDNLKTGTSYYYKATVDGKEFPGTFKTAESTRFVNIPGAKNTRDIGGYTTLDGKKVKQGVLIRGTEIDGLVEPEYFLDKDYAGYVEETFGFVCDLDLRETYLFSGNYQSRLGKEVIHKFYDSPQYGTIFSKDFQPALKQIFADLANPANYPMYLHCTYGADRTGTVCFMLEGILNYPEEVMQMDYQLTGFNNPDYADAKNYNTIYGGLEGYKGDTVQEKIVNYLTTEIGVTENQIESIRSIFIED